MDEQFDGQSPFTSGVAQLLHAVAGADPLALAPTGQAAAEQVERSFAEAADDTRARLLLYALDQAVAALELAAHLADEQQARSHAPGTPPPPVSGPLAEAYAAFVEAQPTYQALYHYRNALARALSAAAPTPLPEA